MRKTMTALARDADGQVTLGGARLADLLTSAGVSTPAYFYDLDGIQDTVTRLEQTLGDRDHLVAYAVKANSAGTILKTMASAGVGACLVSGNELKLARSVGIPANRMVINGVAKQDWELDLAIAEELYGIQAESVEELERIAARAAQQQRTARVGLRINPGVEIDSHSHIATGHDEAKFGIPRADLPAALERLKHHAAVLRLVGVSTHVGSMLTSPASYLASAATVCDLARDCLAQGLALEYVNFGGGFGISDGKREAPPPHAFAEAALQLAEQRGLTGLRLVLEPGRSLVGSFGMLVAKVIQAKAGHERRWLMIDAGMNDLIRPALYGALHRVEPLERAPSGKQWRVVGPICESSDDFGTHAIGEPPRYVVVRDAGAYGFCMASQYNARGLPHEVFVREGQVVHVSRGSDMDAWLTQRQNA